ncbi:MAG TPA: serine hydrolase [Patescibacteria group bacterium]|nr:serine hydrolase [Patescibacteria group bacterium]
MNLPFRKKKEENEELDPIPEIKPVRRRKKKEEPPKPWGRIERLIIFIFLIGLPVLSIIFFIKSKSSRTAVPAKINAPIINNFVPLATPDTDELNTTLNNEISNLTGTYGIYLKSVDGSYSLGINDNIEFDGASLFKLPLMIAYYQAVDNGKIDPQTSYTLKYSDDEGGAGILASMAPGTVVTYKDIVQAMGKNSDNTGFQIMENVLGQDAETNEISNLNMNNTDFSQSETTPYDIGSLFYQLNNTNLISNSSKDEFYSFLTNTDFENLIPAGVPSNIKVVHKYGADDGELNDAGIVYAAKPYILVIMSKDIDEDQADVEIPKISKIVYDWSTHE